MKQDRLAKWASPCRGRVQPVRIKSGIAVALGLAVALLCIPESSANKPGKKGEVKPKTAVTSPKLIEPVVDVKSVGPQAAPALSASGAEETGRELTWQVISAGAIQGGTSGTLELSRAPGYELDETIGQLAVGSGSSNSYDVNSGFLPGFEEGAARGDANGDGIIDLGDAVYILNYLFKGGPAPVPLQAGDANCDGLVELGDAIYLLNYLFKGGPPPGC